MIITFFLFRFRSVLFIVRLSLHPLLLPSSLQNQLSVEKIVQVVWYSKGLVAKGTLLGTSRI